MPHLEEITILNSVSLYAPMFHRTWGREVAAYKRIFKLSKGKMFIYLAGLKTNSARYINFSFPGVPALKCLRTIVQIKYWPLLLASAQRHRRKCKAYLWHRHAQLPVLSSKTWLWTSDAFLKLSSEPVEIISRLMIYNGLTTSFHYSEAYRRSGWQS